MLEVARRKYAPTSASDESDFNSRERHLASEVRGNRT